MESRTPLAYIKPIEYKKNSWWGCGELPELAGIGFPLKGLEERL
jgi:hypothetical protein